MISEGQIEHLKELVGDVELLEKSDDELEILPIITRGVIAIFIGCILQEISLYLTTSTHSDSILGLGFVMGINLGLLVWRQKNQIDKKKIQKKSIAEKMRNVIKKIEECSIKEREWLIR